MAASAQQTIASLYLAYYGRPADPEGLASWTKALIAANGNVESIVNAFATSPEAAERFKEDTVESRVKELYQNLFGRAPEDEGLAAWTKYINEGHATLAQAAHLIMQGARDDDQQLTEKRIEAANSFTEAVKNGDLSYQGTQAAEAAKLLLAAISKDSSAEQVKTLVLQTSKLVDQASEQPEVVAKLLGKGGVDELVKSETFAKDSSKLLEAMTRVADQAKGDAKQVEKLLGSSTSLLDKLDDQLAKGGSLDKIIETVKNTGLDGLGKELDTPVTPPSSGGVSDGGGSAGGDSVEPAPKLKLESKTYENGRVETTISGSASQKLYMEFNEDGSKVLLAASEDVKTDWLDPAKLNLVLSEGQKLVLWQDDIKQIASTWYIDGQYQPNGMSVLGGQLEVIGTKVEQNLSFFFVQTPKVSFHEKEGTPASAVEVAKNAWLALWPVQLDGLTINGEGLTTSYEVSSWINSAYRDHKVTAVFHNTGTNHIVGNHGADNFTVGAGTDRIKLYTGGESSPSDSSPGDGEYAAAVDVVHGFTVGQDKLEFDLAEPKGAVQITIKDGKVSVADGIELSFKDGLLDYATSMDGSGKLFSKDEAGNITKVDAIALGKAILSQLGKQTDLAAFVVPEAGEQEASTYVLAARENGRAAEVAADKGDVMVQLAGLDFTGKLTEIVTDAVPQLDFAVIEKDFYGKPLLRVIGTEANRLKLFFTEDGKLGFASEDGKFKSEALDAPMMNGWTTSYNLSLNAGQVLVVSQEDVQKLMQLSADKKVHHILDLNGTGLVEVTGGADIATDLYMPSFNAYFVDEAGGSPLTALNITKDARLTISAITASRVQLNGEGDSFINGMSLGQDTFINVQTSGQNHIFDPVGRDNYQLGDGLDELGFYSYARDLFSRYEDSSSAPSYQLGKPHTISEISGFTEGQDKLRIKSDEMLGNNLHRYQHAFSVQSDMEFKLDEAGKQTVKLAISKGVVDFANSQDDSGTYFKTVDGKLQVNSNALIPLLSTQLKGVANTVAFAVPEGDGFAAHTVIVSGHELADMQAKPDSADVVVRLMDTQVQDLDVVLGSKQLQLAAGQQYTGDNQLNELIRIGEGSLLDQDLSRIIEISGIDNYQDRLQFADSSLLTGNFSAVAEPALPAFNASKGVVKFVDLPTETSLYTRVDAVLTAMGEQQVNAAFVDGEDVYVLRGDGKTGVTDGDVLVKLVGLDHVLNYENLSLILV